MNPSPEACCTIETWKIEKGLNVVVGIDVLLVMVFHPPQGVTMIGMMSTYFSTEHHGKKMRCISALQLLEPKRLAYGKIIHVSLSIGTHVKFQKKFPRVPWVIPSKLLDGTAFCAWICL